MVHIYAAEIRLVVYVIGIYAVFIYWGFLQERIISVKYPVDSLATTDTESLTWQYPFALNICMAFTCYLTALAIGLIQPSMITEVPFVAFWKAALTAAVASPIGYEALKYIPYPLMVLTKSSKPVPVMFVGLVYFRKSYEWYKYVGVALVCLGITLFSYYKTSKKPTQSSIDSLSPHQHSSGVGVLLFGIVLVLVNLALDGYTNNEQDYIFSSYKITSLDMMKNVNLWQSFYLAGLLIAGWLVFGEQSELSGALNVVVHCSTFRFDLLMFCLFAAAGQILLFTLIKEFGSLLWVTVSVTRKLFTVLASVFLFEHAVNAPQWLGISSVFAGLLLEIVMGHKAMQEAKTSKKKGE